MAVKLSEKGVQPVRALTSGAPKWCAALGFATGLGAIVASSCCVIPLGLAALGAGAGVLTRLEAISEWRTPFLAASGVTVVTGWAAWWRRRRMACVPSSPCASHERSWGTLALLFCATAIIAAAAGWDQIDPLLLKLLRGR